MELDQYRERSFVAVVGAREEIHLPGRQAALEGPLHQLGGDGGGLGGEVAVGEADVVHMPSHVEVRGHGPGGAADGEQNVTHPHPQPGDRRGTTGEQVEEAVAAPCARPGGRRGHGSGSEECQGAEMHRMTGGLKVPERQVERCEELAAQWFLMS